MTALLALTMFSFADTDSSLKVLDVTNYNIVRGVREETVDMKNSSNDSVVAHVLYISPESNVKIRASYGNYYTNGSTKESRASKAKSWSSSDWNFKSTTTQAKAYENATGEKVIGATNGDYFNMATGQPLGSVILEGNPDLNPNNQEPYFALLKDGKYVLRDASVPKSDVEECISSPFFLLRDGQIVSGDDTSLIPRNSIGMRKDGTIVVCEIDGRLEKSVGASVHELANYLKSIGVVNALYLDGGGSATLATRREGTGKLEVANTPSDGSERAVSSALLFVDYGSLSSEFDHASISPRNEIYTPGSEITFHAKGVSTSGDPAELPTDNLKWSLAADSVAYGSIDATTGVYKDNGLYPERHTVNVVLKYGNDTIGTGKIIIAAPDELRFVNDSLNLEYGIESDLGFRAYCDGREVKYKDGDFEWSVSDKNAGNMVGNHFKASENNKEGNLSVKTEIQVSSKWNAAVTAKVTVGIGTKPQVIIDGGDTDKLNYDSIPYTHEDLNGNLIYETNQSSQSDLIVFHYMNTDGSSRGGIASAEQINIDNGQVRFGQKALKLNYDFRKANGTEGASFGFNHDILLTGNPSAIGVWVYAPEGTPNLWLRMYVNDGNMNKQVLNFTDEQVGIDFSGWKYLTAELKDSNGNPLKGPFTLRKGELFRIMYVPWGPGQNGRFVWVKDSKGEKTKREVVPQAGSIYIDNLQFVYGNDPSDTDNPVVSSVGAFTDKDRLTEIQKNGETILHENTVNFTSSFEDVQNRHTSGIDFTYIYVDGVNMTKNQNCSVDLVNGKIDLNNVNLPNGEHTVEILTRDKYGNETKETRSFTVDADNTLLTSVQVKPEEKTAQLGGKYVLDVNSDNVEKINNISFDLKLDEKFGKPSISYGDGFKGTDPLYDEKNKVWKFLINRQGSTNISGPDNVAKITISVPHDLKNPSYLTYRVQKGAVSSGSGGSGETEATVNTFETASHSVSVQAGLSLAVEPITVGSGNAVFTVKDTDENSVENATVYKVSQGGNTVLGKTDQNGILSTADFTDAVQKYEVYAVKDTNYSWHIVGQSANSIGDADGKPYDIHFNATKNGSTEKNISWFTKNTGAETKAIVEYVEKSIYDANHEDKFLRTEGSSKVTEFHGSGNEADNYNVNVNSVTLTGLHPNIEYMYRVGDGKNWSDVKTFRSGKAFSDSSNETNLFLIGDTQSQGDDQGNLKTIAEKVSHNNYDLGIQLGDSLEEPAIYSGWDNILKSFGQFGPVDFMHVIGNHESVGDKDAYHANAIYHTPSSKYYSVTYGNVYIATIAYSPSGYEDAAKWLENDAKASTAEWKILVMHQPPFYTNDAGSNEGVNKVIPPAVDAAGIDFVFSGHDHSYARTYPITKGKEAEDVDEDALKNGEAYSGDGAVYFICGSTGEKSYSVNTSHGFPFAVATQDYDHGIYLSVKATDDEFTIKTYNGSDEYDSFTKKSKCASNGHKYAFYSDGKVYCSVCGRGFDARELKYTGKLKDKDSGKSMYLVDGKPQKGFFRNGEKLYLFDRDGRGMTKTFSIAGTDYSFDDGEYAASSDKNAGAVEIGFCGADDAKGGQNLIYVYNGGDKVLNIGLNPLEKKANGEMKNWSMVQDVPWQDHRYDVTSVNIGDGVENIGNFFLYNMKKSNVKQFEGVTASLKEVNLPASIKEIGRYAFANKLNLKEITLPKNLEKVGYRAFLNDSGIQVEVEGEEPFQTGLSVFTNCGTDAIITVPDNEKWHEAVNSGALEFPGTIRYRNKETGVISIPSNNAGSSGAGGTTDENTKQQEQNQAAADDVTALIQALPSVNDLTKNDADKVSAVRKSYESLSDEQKKLVPSKSVEVLVTAENQIKKIEANEKVYINLSKVRITKLNPSVKRSGTRTRDITIKWTKVTKANGFQIQYSMNRKFLKSKKYHTKTISVKNIHNKTTKKTIRKLSQGKTYYFRIRAYKNSVVNKKTIRSFGKWSKVTKIKISTR